MVSGLVQRTIRARSIRRASRKCLSYIFIPSMRSSTLLLASFLAVLPVSPICLVLNLRIHMNEFVHSLYLRSLTVSFVSPFKRPMARLIS